MKDNEIIEKLLKVHRPQRIYTECDHPQTVAGEYVDFSEPQAHDGKTPLTIEDIGWTCQDGLLYVVCAECCMDGGDYQLEQCADEHTHTAETKDICITRRTLDEREAA